MKLKTFALWLVALVVASFAGVFGVGLWLLALFAREIRMLIPRRRLVAESRRLEHFRIKEINL